MITTQLLLLGTPEELKEILSKLNGSTTVLSKFGDPMTEAAASVGETKPKKAKQVKMDLEPEVETTTVTAEDLRALVQVKAKAGKRDDIKKLLKEFGAASVTELDEENYAEFKLKLEKL